MYPQQAQCMTDQPGATRGPADTSLTGERGSKEKARAEVHAHRTSLLLATASTGTCPAETRSHRAADSAAQSAGQPGASERGRQQLLGLGCPPGRGARGVRMAHRTAPHEQPQIRAGCAVLLLPPFASQGTWVSRCCRHAVSAVRCGGEMPRQRRRQLSSRADSYTPKQSSSISAAQHRAAASPLRSAVALTTIVHLCFCRRTPLVPKEVPQRPPAAARKRSACGRTLRMPELGRPVLLSGRSTGQSSSRVPEAAARAASLAASEAGLPDSWRWGGGLRSSMWVTPLADSTSGCRAAGAVQRSSPGATLVGDVS
mmetsp:Transcript_8843/g.25497  ORF Transcript_8843/g.25497 Transcript_8843/m.25497 type:complete len:314 (+) Transcript_8843:358-1299(+)